MGKRSRQFAETNNQRGMAIIAILMAAGVIGLIVFALSKTVMHGNRMAKNSEAIGDYAIAKTNIKMLLSNKVTCLSSLQNVVFPAIGDTSDTWQSIQIKSPLGAVLYEDNKKVGGLIFEEVVAKTGGSSDGVFAVEVKINAKKESVARLGSLGDDSIQDFFKVTVTAPSGAATQCVYQSDQGWPMIARTDFFIKSHSDATDMLMINSAFPDTVLWPSWGDQIDEKDVASTDLSVKMPFRKSASETRTETITAQGNRWALTFTGDAEGRAPIGSNTWVCGWILVEIRDKTTGNLVLQGPESVVGFSCNSWTRPSRSEIVLTGLRIGRSYAIEPHLVRQMQGPENGYAATRGVFITVNEYLVAP